MFGFSYKNTPSAVPVAVVLDRPQAVVEDGKKQMKVFKSGDPLVDSIVYVCPKEELQGTEREQKRDFKNDLDVELKMHSGRYGKYISRKDEKYLKEHLDDDDLGSYSSHRPKKQARLSKLHQSVKSFVKTLKQSLRIPDHLYFFALPNLDLGCHDVIYLVGKGGSGKSLWVATYVALWKQLHPKYADRFFLISEKPKDESIDHLGPQQIVTDEAFVEKWTNMKDGEEGDISKYANSVFVFDDFAAISSVATQKAIKCLQHKLLHMARQYKIDVLVTQHEALQGHRTKHQLADVTKFVFFPWSGGVQQITNVATRYGGLSKKDIKWVMDIGKQNKFSVTCNLSAPQYMISASEIRFTE